MQSREITSRNIPIPAWPHLRYVWQILLLNMKLLAYIWHSACENSHFESTFLELSTRATAIYKRDASSQTLKSAIYSRDTRESALFST